MAEVRILVAEDNEINQMLIKAMLAKLGHDAVVVENGAKAVEAVEKEEAGAFDLILMDVEMPEMNGVIATGRIRALDGGRARTPIIALTANAMEGDREKYLAAGMSDYLSKPIDMEDLHRVILRNIGGQ